jgi:glycosyltransferase involved in cell wall biosynthesis
MIKISIALVTRNRPKSLARALKSICRQSVQPYEVVVSDDSDTDFADETKVVAEKWNCRYVAGPRRGLYANRNHVALACRGTHIRTMDDDHLLPEGHMAQCLEAVRSDPQSIWTTGEVAFLNGIRYFARTASQLAPSGVGETVKDVNDNWAIADGSTIYPAIIFAAGHRMLEQGYGSSYLEFGAYLYHHGFKSRCILDAVVEHYPEDNSILMRGYNIEVLESQMFAMLCANLYFKPNYILLARYLLPCLWRVSTKKNSMAMLFSSFGKARERWSLPNTYGANQSLKDTSLPL